MLKILTRCFFFPQLVDPTINALNEMLSEFISFINIIDKHFGSWTA